MENIKPQSSTQNLESDKSAALLTQDELNEFKKLPIIERRKKTEAELNAIIDLNNELREAYEKVKITGDATEIEEIKKKDKEVKMRIADLQELVDVKASYEEEKEYNKQKISNLYDKCFSILNVFSRKLSKDDLRFIYQLDSKIDPLGMSIDFDMKFKKIKESRKDKKKDLAIALDLKPEEISLEGEDAFSSGIKFYYGSLHINKDNFKEGLVIPDVSYKLSFEIYIKSLKGIVFPKNFSGGIDLHNLKDCKGLVLPENINGFLDLGSLTSAKDLKLPDYIGGDLALFDVESTDGLVLPKVVGGGLFLDGLKSAHGLKLPEKIGGQLSLSCLESTDDFKLPDYNYIGGLDLSSLKSAENLVLPEIIDGDLNLSSFKNIEGLKLPQKINGSLNLNNIKEAVGLKLPEYVGGELKLNKLENAEGVVFPKYVGYDIWLRGLNYFGDLKLPGKVGGKVILSSVNSFAKDHLKEKYPELEIIW